MRIETIISIIAALLLAFFGHWFVGIIVGVVLWTILKNPERKKSIADDLRTLRDKVLKG